MHYTSPLDAAKARMHAHLVARNDEAFVAAVNEAVKLGYSISLLKSHEKEAYRRGNGGDIIETPQRSYELPREQPQEQTSIASKLGQLSLGI